MAIRTECGECYEEYNVKDSFAGETIRCKACGAKILVPSIAEFDDEDYEEDFEEEVFEEERPRPRRRPQRRQRQSTRTSPMVYVGIGAGIIVLLGVITAIAWFVPRMDAEGAGRQAADVDEDDGLPLQGPNWQNQRVIEDNEIIEEAITDNPFAVGKVQLPRFPELGDPRRQLPTGESVYFVDVGSVNQSSPVAGSAIKMRVYTPAGDHEPGSLGCVLVAPAGTNLLVGNDMDDGDYHDETLPYAREGMVVVFYSLDGGVDNLQLASTSQLVVGYKKFKAACAGVVNGRNALEFVLSKIPQVDPKRIYCAGHSSAGTLSLLLAEHESRLAGCIAYAPATNVEQRLLELYYSPVARIFPGLKAFLHTSSPTTHVDRFQCPIFVFHARDDSNEPFETTEQFATTLKTRQKNVTFATADRGDHYQSMIDQGIPKAIEWLKTLPTESANP